MNLNKIKNILVAIPMTFNLFGPVQFEGANKGYTRPEWSFIGSALSSSTKLLWLSHGFPCVANARWLVIWNPGSSNNKIRLISFDSGPSNITEIGVINGKDVNTPLAQAILIKDHLNDLVDNRINKHIGFQVSGDGTGYIIYESRVEIVFDEGAC